MVFFNYSTMQMAAKVVYYGPGLCGKTTNLQWIFEHTSTESRGEMVSLATETDRTLFFDLLPIDVGSIAGFSTRIQLYTVPGQVFYNTTRKLVLKGVDGVVFVADSQRPMLQANVESFQNLEENLAEMGLSLDNIPVVLQFNKRDLPGICSFEELNQALNRQDWPAIEASALNGQGVFETLKMISKATLLALKKRLTKSRPEGASTARRPMPPVTRPPIQPPPSRGNKPRPPAAVKPPAPAPPAPEPEDSASDSAIDDALSKFDVDLEPPALEAAEPSPDPVEEIASEQTPVAAETEEMGPPAESAASDVVESEPFVPAAAVPVEAEPVAADLAEPEPESTGLSAESAEPSVAASEPPASEPLPEPTAPAPVAPAPAAPATVAPEPEQAAVIESAEPENAEIAAKEPVSSAQQAVDALLDVAPARRKKRRARASGFDALQELEKLRRQTIDPRVAAVNGKREIKRSVRMTLNRADFSRAHRVTLTLKVEDADLQVVDEARHVHVDLENAESLEELLLRLNIALNATA